MRDIYQEITNRIIAELEQGKIPWHCSWRPAEWRHRNMVSQKAYRGINAILLNGSKYDSPFWLTARQIQKSGGKLRPDESPTHVVFWKFFNKLEADGTEGKGTIPFLREYPIYNLEQTVGIPAKHIPILPTRQTLEFQPIENAELILAGYVDAPHVIHSGNEACYSPAFDRIRMPSRSSFDNEEEYYSTLFHEQIHSTGHAKRLKRAGTEVISFGSATYSKEELIAEMGAAFLCAYSGIENTTIKNSAAYIKSWLSKLKNDKKLVVQAAQAAQKATDYVLRITHKRSS